MISEEETQRLKWMVFQLAKLWTVEVASGQDDVPLFLILAGSDCEENEQPNSATLLEVNPEAVNDGEGSHSCQAIWNFDNILQARSEAELRYVLSQIKA